MRKFLVAAILTAMIMLPAAARAGFLLEASVGQGYQTAPTPRQWEQTNLELSPGWAPSLPVLSWFRLQLGIVMDFASRSGTSTNMELRPMLSLVPPVFPIYGRVIVGVANLFERGSSKREVVYGGVLGVRVGLPGISFVPAMGIFAEAGLIPRKRDFVAGVGTSDSKFAWVVEGRAGAYINF